MTEFVAVNLSSASAIVLAASSICLAMADAVAISIVTNVGAVVLAGIAATVSWRTHRAVNSRMTTFLTMAKKAFKAQGKLAGVALEKRRNGGVNTYCHAERSQAGLPQ